MDALLWNPWAITALCALTLLILSVIGDHRRRGRRNLNKAGFMPWPFLTVMSGIVFLFGTALAIKLG